jgi:hypothetical protein
VDARTYAESELVVNRASVLLWGGTPSDRAAWAQEAAELAGRPLITVTRLEQLPTALAVRDTVLYLPEVLALGDAGQQLLVRSLTSLEDRPKLVLGLGRSDASARNAGMLREDLHYRLRMGLLNLDEPGLREAIAARRLAASRRPPSSARPAPARPPGTAAPPRFGAAPSTTSRVAPARPSTPRAAPKPTGRKAAARKRPAARAKPARSHKAPKKKSSKRR